MNLARIAIEKSTITLVLSFVMLVAGIFSFTGLSRMEDPEFTIKEALVITPYPGATATEVMEEVSDELEIEIQKMGQLDEVESRSERGLSTLTVRIKKNYDKVALPQVWDELRRKVNDAQMRLPPGAGPSLVVDDFGDVMGVFFAIYGEGFSFAELNDVVENIRRELLLVDDVAKVEIYGNIPEVIYIIPDRDRLALLGLPPDTFVSELKQKNLVIDAGRVIVGSEFISIEPTGVLSTVLEFEGILLSKPGDPQQIYLRDVARVERGYKDPATNLLRFGGNKAIGVGISTVPGGNVVTMGKAVEKRLREMAAVIPLGIEFGIISLQSTATTEAIDGFIINLIAAIVIVVGVLVFFMGMRSSLIIGFILLLTVTGTFIFMSMWGVALERISLGALVIALGMLVDNAIVVVDGMIVKIGQGVKRKKAAEDVVGQTAWPLLGATLVAILAFAAIGTSDDSTGEFTRSLYQVILISLSLSWVTGMTVTPLLCVMFLKEPEKQKGQQDPYGGKFFNSYRALLRACIKRRVATIMVVIGLFGVSIYGFGFVDQTFFPESTRPQFMLDYWNPQGTHINETEADVVEIEGYLMAEDGVANVTSFVGKGALRFILTYAPEKQNNSYAQFLVDVEDYKKIDEIAGNAEAFIQEHFPGSLVFYSKFRIGPGGGGKIQARLIGPNPDVLRSLAAEVENILYEDGGAKAIRNDWRQRVKIIVPVIAEEQANLNGISREQIAFVLKNAFEGVAIGIYRDGDDLLTIISRAEDRERMDVASIQDLQIWSPAAGQRIPLRQVVSGFETKFSDQILMRLDRKQTITVHADPKVGSATKFFSRIRPQVEAIALPVGYFLEWGGEYEDSGEAQESLAAGMPPFFIMMVLIVIVLFNALRQPLIIWLTVPLALIGVTFGLLVTNQAFGFMALLGFMSLSGMLIKNAIVLIDQIEIEKSEGKQILQAIIEAGVSRLRPVGMAAATTALGMLPLLTDAFFVAMAVTIIFGLVFATLLTMVVVPTLYAIFFRA